MTVHDLSSGGMEWNAAGANFLVRRLAEAFALGGEAYRSLEPFTVQMVGAFKNAEPKTATIQKGDAETEADADIDMQDAVFRLLASALSKESYEATNDAMASPSPEEFNAYIRQTYVISALNKPFGQDTQQHPESIIVIRILLAYMNLLMASHN